MANFRSCLLCGKEYKFCPTCGEDRYAPVWKNTFCSEDCSRIFKCAMSFYMSLITKEEAMKIVSECDTTNIEAYRDDIKQTIKKIMTVDKVNSKVVENDNLNVEIVDNNEVDNNLVFKKIEYTPRKKNKHEVVE